MSANVVAILGATGVVGQQMLQCLEERNFPVERLVPLASARSVSKTVTFRGEQVPVVEAAPEAFEGIDIVLGAAGDGTAKAKPRLAGRLGRRFDGCLRPRFLCAAALSHILRIAGTAGASRLLGPPYLWK